MNPKTLTEKFEQIINLFPEQIAVAKPNCFWNYQQLDRHISIIQRQLRAYHLSPQSVIGLLINDPLWLAASIWAAIRERLIYLVLDPHYPLERLSYLMQDSQASLLLIDQEAGLLPLELIENFPHHQINFDLEPLSQTEIYLQSCQTEDYITLCYTSGSTGNPKGVIHNHANILYQVRTHTATLNITPLDRFSALYSLVTVGSHRDFFVPLLNGASCNFFPLQTVGLHGFFDWCYHRRLTILHAVPVLFRELNHQCPEPKTFESIRVVFVAGDRLLTKDIKLFRQNFPKQARFYTGFGASETSSLYTHWFIPPEDTLDYSLLPLGYPLSETEVFLVDEKRCKIVPTEIGEIAVCSHYLSLGYFGKNEITKQVFQDSDNGRRIYFTGDQGYFDDQGRLVFLGRKDHQVKIRGFRVELGEIETVLNQYSPIKETVVIAKENKQGNTYLVAYLITKEKIKTQEIRQFLSGKLPDYMIPASFVFLDKFPLTPNGKIDRKGLPELDFSVNLDHEYIAPRNEIETKLANIWQQVLGREKIGIKDNFFELGGHSLLAIQIISRIRTNLGVELPLRNLFEYPTIKQLAELIEGISWQLSSNNRSDSDNLEEGEI